MINGITRNVDEDINLWCSDGIGPGGEKLTIKLPKAEVIGQVRLTFDPNLSEERCISVSRAFIDKEPLGVDKELVKDYRIILQKQGQTVWEKEIKGNYQRLNIIDLPEKVEADEVHLLITATNGDPDARVFEIRLY